MVAGLWGHILGENWPPEPTSSYASIDFWCQLVASLATTALTFAVCDIYDGLFLLIRMEHCKLRIQVSQGTAATDLRRGGCFDLDFLRSRYENSTVQELLKSVYICQSYCVTLFLRHSVLIYGRLFWDDSSGDTFCHRCEGYVVWHQWLWQKFGTT